MSEVKQFDLCADPEMSPVVGLLHAMVTYNYERLKKLVAGLEQSDIDFRGYDGEHNSIAQLLQHLAVVDLHWVYRLQSSTIPDELKENYGTMYDQDGKLPMVKDVSLLTLLEQYEQVQMMFKAVCTRLTDEDLAKYVPFNENTASIQWGIWHIADHSRHHYANIVDLKKMLRQK